MEKGTGEGLHRGCWKELSITQGDLNLEVLSSGPVMFYLANLMIYGFCLHCNQEMHHLLGMVSCDDGCITIVVVTLQYITSSRSHNSISQYYMHYYGQQLCMFILHVHA